MKIKPVIQSQYLASLAMLKQAVVKCPSAAWNAPRHKDKFWYKAYHTLYYAHKYLQVSNKVFVPWEKHHNPDKGVPFSKQEILEYLAFVEEEVVRRVPLTDLEAESGFRWLRFDKLELQFYNIRHIQQHTGELYERLGARKNIKLGWVDRKYRRNK
jgi:hypothetical protein